jgi:hypothetical protein
MRETGRMVINTGPIIALVAALGALRVLELLYGEVTKKCINNRTLLFISRTA